MNVFEIMEKWVNQIIFNIQGSGLTMKRLARNMSLRTIGRSSQLAYNPEANDNHLRSWSHRLNNLASSGPSKVYLAQLTALLNFYTRQSSDNTQEIDWSAWNNKIITEGLVDKVRKNYQQQSKQEYELDKIFNEIFNKDSKAIDVINSEMSFHTAVWLDNYCDYAFFLNDLQSISNFNDYSPVEFYDMHEGAEVAAQALIETNSFFQGARSDINLYGYMAKQFAWGKKVFTFYRHPADNFNTVKATKNSMGR